ncbi:MAG: hypothetical protein Q8O67_23310 [Deltaproteobacteria bacterium]|nr:hypothetical protein [Deltaproteobacteria bacterium]
MRNATVSLSVLIAIVACAPEPLPPNDLSADVVDDDDDGPPTEIANGLSIGDDGDLGPAADPGCGARTLFSVGAAIVDDTGQPIAGARMQMCTHSAEGTFACLRPTAADAAGIVRVEFPERTRCLERVVARVLVDADHGTVTCGVALGGTDTTPTFSEPIVVPRVARGARAGDDVSLAGGLSLTVDDDVAPGLDLASLGAGMNTSSCVAAAAPTSTTKLWALSPEGGLESPGLAARLADTGLAAGTRVSAHVLGGLDCQLPDGTDVERGAFAAFASGLRVDDDGGLDLGSIPCLTWLALSLD